MSCLNFLFLTIHAVIFLRTFSMSWITPSLRLSGDTQLIDFVEGLGPAQMVGRQVLGKKESVIFLAFFRQESPNGAVEYKYISVLAFGFSRKKLYPHVEDINFFFLKLTWIYSRFDIDPPRIFHFFCINPFLWKSTFFLFIDHVFSSNFDILTPLEFQLPLLSPLEFSIDILNKMVSIFFWESPLSFWLFLDKSHQMVL